MRSPPRPSPNGVSPPHQGGTPHVFQPQDEPVLRDADPLDPPKPHGAPPALTPPAHFTGAT